MTLALAKIVGTRQAWLFRVVAGAFAVLAGCPGVNAQSNWPGTTAALPASTEAQLKGLLNEPSPLGDRTLGDRGAPVTVIEYASLGCAVCAAFHKTTFAQFKTAYIDTGKVYLYLPRFPHRPVCATAPMAARCVPEKDFFAGDKFTSTDRQWTARRSTTMSSTRL